MVHALKHHYINKISVFQLWIFKSKLRVSKCESRFALRLGLLQLLHQLFLLPLESQRSNIDERVHWVTDYSCRFNFLNQPIAELIVHGRSNNESFRINARLARISHPARICSVNSPFHIGILQDDERIRASQFKTSLFNVPGAENGDVCASFGAAREFTCPDSAISEDLCALILIYKHVRVLTFAESCLRHRILDSLRTQWGGRRMLEQDGVAENHGWDHRLEG